MENLFQEECTLSKDSVERYGIAMKKHAQEWVAEIEQMFMDTQENNMLESTVPIRIVRHNAPFTLQHIRSAFSHKNL